MRRATSKTTPRRVSNRHAAGGHVAPRRPAARRYVARSLCLRHPSSPRSGVRRGEVSQLRASGDYSGVDSLAVVSTATLSLTAARGRIFGLASGLSIGIGKSPCGRRSGIDRPARSGTTMGMPSTGAITIWRPRRGRVSCGRSRGDGTASKLTGGIAGVEVVSSACGHSNATAVGANVSRINRLMVFLRSDGTGR